MDIILVPGLWLDAASWDEVTPLLEEAGHRALPITLPGMESKDADRSQVSRQDCVDAIVARIDASEGPVAIVGHSMGAGLAHAAVDARPDRVVRAIYVGGFPDPDGSRSEFPTKGGEIPLLDWSEFDEADLTDLDDAGRALFSARAVPSPARMASDPQHLSDERRYSVPVTMVCPEFSSEMLKGWVAEGMEPVRELTEIQEVTYVDLPTGHWPQFTKPAQLARVILEAIG
jgi:pimeloyl-ACP methyl ester carboxylesterase